MSVTVRTRGKRGVVLLDRARFDADFAAIFAPPPAVEVPKPAPKKKRKKGPKQTPSTLTPERLRAKIERARAFGKAEDVARLEAKFAKMFGP